MIQSILSNQTLLFANTAVASIALAIVGILIARSTIRLGPETQHHLLMTVAVLLLVLPIGQSIAYVNGVSWFEFQSTSDPIPHAALDQPENAAAAPGSLAGGVVWSVVAIWLVVSIAKCCWIGRMLLRRNHLKQPHGSHPTQRLQGLVQKASDQVGIVCPRCIQVSTRACPMVLGIRRPTLVIPRDLECELSDSQILSILHHEMEHIRRGDNGHAIIQSLVQCIYWWNPAVTVLMSEIKAKREWACDDRALEQTTNARGYAETLLAVARWVSDPTDTLAGQQLLSRRNDLVQRVRRFSARQQRRGSPSKRSIIACLASVLLVAVPTFVPLGVFREVTEQTQTVSQQPDKALVCYLSLDAQDEDALHAISNAIEQQARTRGSGLIVDLRQTDCVPRSEKDNRSNSPVQLPQLTNEISRHSVSMVLILGDSSQKATALVRQFASARANVIVLEADEYCKPECNPPLRTPQTDEWCDADVQLTQAIDILSHA